MIIDFHTHIFPPTFATDRARFVETDEVMDKDGVGQSVIMGIGWADSGVAREANDYIIDAVSRFPDRLVGFAGVNPAWGADAVGEINRCADAGLRGVGELHSDSQGFDLGDQRSMTPLMEAVEARGLIITTHSSEPVGHVYQGKGMTRPEVLWQFIRNFPEATVVCAHWGGGLPFYESR